MAYFESTKLKDAQGNPINPVENEQIILLRRLIKLIESQSATDIANRQRITLDNIAAGLTLGAVGSIISALPAGTNAIGNITSIVNALPAGTNAIGNITNLTQLAGADQRQFIDVSRTNYNTGIRSRLTFS